MASVYSAKACLYCLALKPWTPMSFALHATFVAMLAHVYWPVLKVLDCTLFYKIGGHKLDSQNSQTRLICIFSVLQRVQQNPFSITNLSASASSYSPSAHHGTSAPCTKYCLFTECTAQHITTQHDMACKALHSTAQHSRASHAASEGSASRGPHLLLLCLLQIIQGGILYL